MTFADLVRGVSLFVDANCFVFHFQPHALFGSSCTDLLKRVELQEFSGYTSTQVLGEVAHRLMTFFCLHHQSSLDRRSVRSLVPAMSLTSSGRRSSPRDHSFRS
jgi:hypothetical protein